MLDAEQGASSPVGSTIWNCDVTSIQLGKDVEAEAIITENAQRLIKAHNLSVTVTQAQTQYRCCKLMTLVNASGILAATIIILKDRELKELKCYQVR